jgi:glycosyltransferase involved in cell wall biosynthesis
VKAGTGRSVARRPTLGFVGIHAAGRSGQAPGQDETVAALFAQEGFRVRSTSAVKRPALRTAHQAWSILTWRDVDVLIVAVYSGPSFFIAELASKLGRLTGKRVILFLHGGRLPEFAATRRRRVTRVLESADRVLAPSDYLASAFRSWGIDVGVVPNVLRVERYVHAVRSPARPRLLWMRTFDAEYDPLTAVRAFAALVARVPEATMTMAGADHGMLDATKAEAAKLDVAGAVHFPGYLGEPEKRAAFADHDIYVNTNLVDNMPISVLEAAASGHLIVATAVSGIPSLLSDGVDSVLVPAGDHQRIADEIADLLDDADRCARLSTAARALAERSSWPAVLEEWERTLAFVAPEVTA